MYIFGCTIVSGMNDGVMDMEDRVVSMSACCVIITGGGDMDFWDI